MPVWHRATEKWRASGELQLVGITQEQHPDRCQLFAQWQGIEWPILWDPFNLTGSTAVPFACLIDEHGVVRDVVRKVETIGDSFLAKEFEKPNKKPNDLFDVEHRAALADLLWKGTERMDAAIESLEKAAKKNPRDAALLFHAGVARRMRTDSPLSRPDDFQAAIDHWAAARAIDPNQYIWRRRIQQYGPRLDKPYPFYTWVDQARDEIRARGETPVALVAELTGSERAGKARFAAAAEATAPDPDGKIHRDAENLVAVETAVAWDTSGKSATATVHVTLRPDPLRDVHWTNDVEPLTVWIGDPELPEGWKASTRLIEYPQPPSEVSSEVRRVDLEVQLPEKARKGTLKGYALYYVCEGETGECVYRRRDFVVEFSSG